MDEINFVSKNKKSQFKLKVEIGTFIINTRVADKEVENLQIQMKFKSSFSWTYDPLGVISSLRVEKNSSPYTHISKLEIKQYVNQEVCEEKTLQEVEEIFLVKQPWKLQDLKRKS